MKQKLTGYLTIFLFIVMIPMIITLLLRNEDSLPVSGDHGETAGKVNIDGEKNIDLQEYLIGITASQLPGNYSLEAVKAQIWFMAESSAAVISAYEPHYDVVCPSPMISAPLLPAS